MYARNNLITQISLRSMAYYNKYSKEEHAMRLNLLKKSKRFRQDAGIALLTTLLLLFMMSSLLVGFSILLASSQKLPEPTTTRSMRSTPRKPEWSS